jgi:hypothetical protein
VLRINRDSNLKASNRIVDQDIDLSVDLGVPTKNLRILRNHCPGELLAEVLENLVLILFPVHVEGPNYWEK